MADNPVVIVGSLSTEELEKSINEIVATVDRGMTEITSKFDTKLGEINSKVKEFSTSVKDMSNAMKESFEGMGGSFDALAKALDKLSKVKDASKGMTTTGDGSSNGEDGSSNGSKYEEGTIGALKAQIAEITKKIDLEKLYSQELRDQVALLKESENLLKKETTSVPQSVLNSALQSTPKTLQEAEDKLANLKVIQERYANTTKLSVQEQNRLSKAIAQTEKQVERFKNQKPKSMKEILGMDESSVEAISRKLKELRRVQIDPKNANEVKMLSSEYQRLVRLQNEMMGRNLAFINSNNALARSFNYIRNRLVYALSIGALTNFTKQVYEIRAQYELLERSIGVLVGSFQQGSGIFRELSDMALKSPFTLIELGTAAKQLTAYNFAAKDVVDTTRRLADISAALGVPMERLTYNLGQIRAQTVLTARDARDFANAGLPIVKALADYYTKLEGQFVSTGNVYERMTKRMVSYEDVMSVLDEMTDEGGKFFNFQAKQAETLKVQLANLSLAWNNMLNEIGKSNQGLLSAPIKALKSIFVNWRSLDKAIVDIGVSLGIAKAAQLAFNLALSKGTLEQVKNIATNKQAVTTDYMAIFAKQGLTKAQAKYLLATNSGVRTLRKFIAETELLNTKQYLQAKNANNLTKAWYSAQVAVQGLAGGFRAVVASLAALAPQMAALLAISAVVDTIQAYKAGQQAVEDFGNTIRKNAEENANAIGKFMESLNIGNAKDLTLDEQINAWERLREQIEQSTAASQRFIAILLQIPDMGERVNKAKEILGNIQQIHEIMATWNDDTIKVNNGFKVLGIGTDGLSEDLKDFVVAMNNGGDATQKIVGNIEELESNWKSVLSWIYSYTDALKIIQPLNPLSWISNIFGGKEKADIADAWQEIQDEIGKMTQSLFDQLQRDKIKDPFLIKESLEQSLKDAAEQGNWTQQQLLTARIIAEQNFRNYYKVMLDGQHKDWTDALDDRSAAWEAWIAYLTARHKKDFKNMANEEVSQSEWVKSERKKKYEETFESFKKENALAANEIKDTVNDLNKLKVHIKVVYGEPESIGDIERDFLKRTGYWQESKMFKDFAKGASSQGSIIDKLKKAQKELTEEMNKSEKAGGDYWEKNKMEMQARNQDLIRMIHSYNALTDAEEKPKKGSGKHNRDAVLDALKNEISLVEKLQGDYEKLTKAGASSKDALDAIHNAYGSTINLLNKNLQGFGLPRLDLSMITGKNPNEQLNYFKELKSLLESKGLANLERIKALDAVIEKLNVKAETYNLDMVTKGLNNELGKLKEEYELGVEFDANPELGDVFADMIGIDKSELAALPRSYEEFIARAQERINKLFADNNIKLDFNLQDNLNMSKFDEWVKNSGQEVDSKLVEDLKKYVSEANKIRLNETKKQIEEWDKLLGKYAEYEYKKLQIEKDYQREMEVARKKGADDDIKRAIQNNRDREMAKVNFEQFQQTPTWVTATGDLATMTNDALNILIDRIEEYKRTAKDLDPKQITEINKALRRLRTEQRKDSPFAIIANAIDDAKERFEYYQVQIDQAGARIDELNAKLQKESYLTEAETNELSSLTEKTKKWRDEQESLGKISAKSIVQGLSGVKDMATSVMGSVGDMFAAFGDKDTQESLNKVSGVLNQAASFAAMGAAIGGGWGAAIGGVLGFLMGGISALAEAFSGNASITHQIENSEMVVKRLENAYINLNRAIENAYGTEQYYAERIAAANKQAQLAEIKRQLQLEKSRSSKYHDEEKILDLERQVIELENEIDDMLTEIINDFMGISSVSDAIEDMVGSIIDSLRQGENALESFDKSVDDMIANMVKKVFAEKILGKWFEDVWNTIDQQAKNRTQQWVDDLSRLESLWENRVTSEGEANTSGIIEAYRWMKAYGRRYGIEAGETTMEDYEKIKAFIEEQIRNASEFTIEDIKKYAEMLREGRPLVEDEISGLNDLLRQLGLMKDSTSSLSNLQQGIQGITETTANALEAMLNGISQQVYLHSDLLTQIRDTLVGFDMDVQTATQAQMLLQLQQSYAVQLAIQSLLQGWSSANGMAVKVEMI